MRSVRPDVREAERLAGNGVILIGDAVHATPILGGEGANMAITDGIELAEHIAAQGIDTGANFVEARHKTWIKSVENSERQLEEMHALKALHL